MTAIIAGLRAGRTAGEISELNKLPRSLCYRMKMGFYDCIAVGEDHDDVSGQEGPPDETRCHQDTRIRR